MDMQAVAAHVRRRISGAPINLDPFPHIEASEIVPPQYYELILKNLPAPGLLREVDDGRNFQFDPMSLPAAARYAATEFWHPFATFVSQTIMSAALDRFSNRIAAYLDYMRSRCLVRKGWTSNRIREGIASYTSTSVFRRTKGYSSDPHFHRIDEIIACLFYFPPDDRHAHLGTDLYRVVKPFWLSWNELAKYSYVDRACIELARTTKFIPNNALIYFNTPWSIHGNRMQEQSYDRWFSLLTLYAQRDIMGWAPSMCDRIKYNPFGLKVFTPFS